MKYDPKSIIFKLLNRHISVRTERVLWQNEEVIFTSVRMGRFEGRVPVGYHDNGKIKYKSVYARTLSEVKEKMSEVYSIKSKSQYIGDKADCQLMLRNNGLSSAKLTC